MSHIAATITAQLAADDRDAYSAALNTPVIDPAGLSQLIRSDKPAAALALAQLDSQKLWVQAICHAALINERYGLIDPAHAYQAEEVYANFREAIAALTVVEAALAVTMAPETPATLPPMALMQEVAAETAQLLNRLVEEAVTDGDKAQASRFRRERNAYNTAAGRLAAELPLLTPDGSWLVRSKRDNGPTYRVKDGACSCPAGDAGQSCEHVAQTEIISGAWDRLADTGGEEEGGDDLPSPPRDEAAEPRQGSAAAMLGQRIAAQRMAHAA